MYTLITNFVTLYKWAQNSATALPQNIRNLTLVLLYVCNKLFKAENASKYRINSKFHIQLSTQHTTLPFLLQKKFWEQGRTEYEFF